MRIGVPKEIKRHEYRVGLMPESISELVRAGHTIVVESGAGVGVGILDDGFRVAGATIGSGARDIYADADLIVKVKEPQAGEWEQLRPGQLLFAYLHLAADRAQAEGLLRSKCTAIAYETVSDASGGLPLLTPMSEVAGRLAIQAAGEALRRHLGGMGLLLGGVPGVRPANVVVLGGGMVGTQAARMAIGLGANVTILDRSLTRLRELDELFQSRMRTRYSTAGAVKEEIAEADVVVGAVLVPGARAPKLISRSMLELMRPGAVLVDVAIDQGGCFETSRATSHEDPTFVVDGIIHYCVANMPGAVPLTSSKALTNATLPFIEALAAGRLVESPALLGGLNVHNGMITHPAVAESLGLPFVSPQNALANGDSLRH